MASKKFDSTLLYIILLSFIAIYILGCGTNQTGDGAKSTSPWLNFWPHDAENKWTYSKQINGITNQVTKEIDLFSVIQIIPLPPDTGKRKYSVWGASISTPEAWTHLQFSDDGIYDCGTNESIVKNKIISFPIITGEVWGTTATSECLGTVTLETTIGTFEAYEILYRALFHRYFVNGIGEVKRTINIDPPHQEEIIDPEGKIYITDTMETFAITEELTEKNF